MELGWTAELTEPRRRTKRPAQKGKRKQNLKKKKKNFNKPSVSSVDIKKGNLYLHFMVNKAAHPSQQTKD